MKWQEKADSVVLRNFHDYWEDPIINKYLQIDASKRFEGILILRRGKKPLWLSHPFNYEQAKKSFKGKAEIVKYETMKDIKTQLQKHTGHVVGYNPRHQTVASFKNLKKFLKGKKLVDVGEELQQSREIKKPQEIKKITLAAKETRKALRLAKKWLLLGMTEKDLEKKIREQFDRDGFDCAFCTVAFGENTANIHHATTNKKLSYGPVLLDIGAKYEGYIADMGEMIYFGEENPKIRKSKEYKHYLEIKEKVEHCLKEIESLLAPGTKANALWGITKPLGELPFAIGHGIGIEPHDYPAGIGSNSKFELKEGMVLAFEPGIHTKKIGVRIENDYLITKKGYRKLA